MSAVGRCCIVLLCYLSNHFSQCQYSSSLDAFFSEIQSNPVKLAVIARRDSVPYAALYIAPILIDTRLHSTRGQFFIRHECGAMYTSQNEHFAYTYDIAVCIWIQYIRHHLSAYFR